MKALFKSSFYILFVVIIINSCAQETASQDSSLAIKQTITIPEKDDISILNPNGNTLESRISPPASFQRVSCEKNSYAAFLRQLPLKPHGSKVQYFDGTTKPNYNTYIAVIDLDIGKKDLHQCADAIMRLRAEYLWSQKRYDEIHFNFTNGHNVEYSEWMKGKRMVVNGNKTYWINKSEPSNSYSDFWNYMELIFNYAGTLSLSRELNPVKLNDMKIGDVFIQGGSPGHAILVADMAINSETKEKLFLLAQSYMPAQETQILHNQNNTTTSPWYSLSEIETYISTPEWTFNTTDLKRFKN